MSETPFVRRVGRYALWLFLAAVIAVPAEAARQQAMNNARGKDHLTGTGTPQGTGAATVPPDEMQAFKLFNPTATEAEITAWYNKHKK